MEDDYYEGDRYEDSVNDYDRFEEQQVYLDREGDDYGDEDYDDEGDEPDHDEDFGPGGEDSYLDSMYEDRYDLGDF